MGNFCNAGNDNVNNFETNLEDGRIYVIKKEVYLLFISSLLILMKKTIYFTKNRKFMTI